MRRPTKDSAESQSRITRRGLILGGAMAGFSGLLALRMLFMQVEHADQFRLLADVHARGLPVPRPLAVRYRRTGLWYRCDLMTARLPAAESMAERLTGAPLDSDTWVAIGHAIRRLHDHGVYHADLNAHNVLLSDAGDVYFVDFDRGSLREPAPGWQRQNMRRLYRSLRKIDRARPDFNFSEVTWSDLDDAYSTGSA